MARLPNCLTQRRDKSACQTWSDLEVINQFVHQVKKGVSFIFANARREMLLILIEGIVEGTSQRGRPRKEYIRDVKTDLGCQNYVHQV